MDDLKFEPDTDTAEDSHGSADASTQTESPTVEQKLSDNITWAQIRSGFQDYRQREVAAKAAAKAVGKSA